MIILVGPLPPPYTGQSVAFKCLIDALMQENINTAVINLMPNSSRRVGRFSWLRSLDYLFIFLKYFKYICSRQKKVIYITIAASKQGFIRDFFFIWMSLFSSKSRLVCHLHGGNYGIFYDSQGNFLKWLIRRTLSRAEQIIILSDRLQAMFSFEKCLKEKITVVPNGFSNSDNLFLEPKTLPKDLVKAPINVLYLSNLIESKGYIDLLKSIDILVNKYHLNIQCDFCGSFMTSPADDVLVKTEEQAQEWFQSFIKKKGLENYVYYHGTVHGTEKKKFLKKSHIFVLPTNYIIEGQPISIIEALAYGNVIISTNYRAIPDMVLDSVTGFLVTYSEPKSIAEKIKYLSKNPDVYSSMSKNAIKHYQENFTNESHLKKMLPLLHESKE